MMNMLWWIPIIIFHEIGHWIGYGIFGYESELKWGGIGFIVHCNEGDKMFVWQSMIMSSLGIILGLVFLVSLTIDIRDYFIYYVISTVDFAYLYIFIINGQFNVRVCNLKDRFKT